MKTITVTIDYIDSLKLEYIQMQESLEIEKIKNKKLEKDYKEMEIIYSITLILMAILIILISIFK
jgi:hypothetical protein